MYDSARDCFTEQQQQEQRKQKEQQDRDRQQQVHQGQQQQRQQDRQQRQEQQVVPTGLPNADTPPRRRISTVGDLLSPVEDINDALKNQPNSFTAPEKMKEAGSPGASSATLTPETPRRDLNTTPGGATATPAASRTADAKISISPTGELASLEPSGGRRERVVSEKEAEMSTAPAATATSTATVKRRKVSAVDSPNAGRDNIYAPRHRSRSPPPPAQALYRRRTPPSGRYKYNSPPPPLISKREPSPTLPPASGDGDRSRESSPPRQRKRPGQNSRFSEEEKAAVRERMRQREEEKERNTKEIIKERGVEEVVKAHYNDKRELGKTWRKTDSRIKGLRSFNNWVKSTIIQKFSPNDDFDPTRAAPRYRESQIAILDMGCGKGGDLLKWKSAPQEVGFYVGVDTADVSIDHAKERYESMIRESRGRRGARPIFQAEFHVMDCWTRWVGEIPSVSRVGIDPNVGPGQSTRASARWGAGGGFDVVSMMFCMHYAFESEHKCRNMLRNVSGALRKGGRFIGTIPASDVISSRVQGKNLLDGSPEKEALQASSTGLQEWGNSIYRIRFAEAPPKNAVFRPPWGWRYSFFLEEAVEEVPEYVVPWEAFRGIAEDYSLELIYKKPFHDIWKEEKDDRDLKVLSERMGVMGRDGRFALGEEEWEACGQSLSSTHVSLLDANHDQDFT